MLKNLCLLWGFLSACPHTLKAPPLRVVLLMADRGGFEPPLRLHVNTLSKRAYSATLPPVQIL